MSLRVLIGLEAGADWTKLRSELQALGADTVNAPSQTQSDLIVATVPDSVNSDQFLTAAKRLPGVRYAERDAWRWSST